MKKTFLQSEHYFQRRKREKIYHKKVISGSFQQEWYFLPR